MVILYVNKHSLQVHIAEIFVDTIGSFETVGLLVGIIIVSGVTIVAPAGLDFRFLTVFRRVAGIGLCSGIIFLGRGGPRLISGIQIPVVRSHRSQLKIINF